MRDRIKELRRVRAGDLKPNPHNWRVHTDKQRAALAEILDEVGFADALVCRELPGGGLELIDGHLRAAENPEAIVPVLVLDVTEEESHKLLATLDPLAMMADADAEALREIADDVEGEELRAMLGEILGDGEETELKPVSIPRPPALTWVLIGIPTVRFGEINQSVEEIAKLEGVICEMTVSDAEENGQPQPESKARPAPALPAKVSRKRGKRN